MIRLTRKLACLPFLWAGQIAAMFKMPAAVGLLKLAFAISGDGGVGRSAILTAHKLLGAGAARLLAEEWMRTCPRPQIAAVGGLFSYDGGDPSAARAMLDAGRALGDDELGMLDLLEYFIVMNGADAAAKGEILRRFDARDDLSSQLTILVRKVLLWTAVEHGDFDQARRRAERLLAVEDIPEAEMAMWVLATRDGRSAEAQACLARVSLKPAERLYYQVLGSRAIGRHDDALAYLEQLDAVDTGVAERLRQVLAGGPPQ